MPRVDYAAISSEFVRVRIKAREDGVVVDPTGDPVEMAFITSKDQNPEEADWVEAEWETSGTTYYARAIPIGLVAGETYMVWVRWTDSEEVPVKALSWIYAY